MLLNGIEQNISQSMFINKQPNLVSEEFMLAKKQEGVDLAVLKQLLFLKLYRQDVLDHLHLLAFIIW